MYSAKAGSIRESRHKDAPRTKHKQGKQDKNRNLEFAERKGAELQT
jgi:hypothetical protein